MTKYLKIIKSSDIFPKSRIRKPKKYTKRQTVRAIVINKKGDIALVTNSVHKIFLLSGCGAKRKNLRSEIKWK